LGPRTASQAVLRSGRRPRSARNLGEVLSRTIVIGIDLVAEGLAR
jgi:hypothetical protein